MVAKASSTQPPKRKKTADMPDSPPKRVTRARAKAPDDAELKPKPTKVTTASMKTAAEKKKKAAPSAKVGKRKTRADDEDVVPAQEPVPEEKPKAKSRTKAIAETIVESGNDEVAVVNEDAPKSKVRQTKAASAPTTKQEAPKTRGRPKRVIETGTVEQKEDIPEPPKKATRTRLASHYAKLSPSTNDVQAKTAPAKRVKFQDQQDKENIPIETDFTKKPTNKATGIRAKPIRKPAAARGTARGKKAVPDMQQATDEATARHSAPLSPKKVTQVAKSSSTGSEDELSGEKTPIKALIKTPSKQSLSPIKDMGSVSKLDFKQANAPSSPSNPTSTSVLASPARKLPQSPFKDCLKSSPKKINLGDNTTQPILLPSRTPVKTSLLQTSPKRVLFGDSAVKPVLPSVRSPFKASLLQSPPKRLMTSPKKGAGPSSPGKSSMLLPVLDSTTPLKVKSPVKANIFSASKTTSSALRAARSPEHAFKVHTMTDEEQEANRVANSVREFEHASPTKRRTTAASAERMFPAPEESDEKKAENHDPALQDPKNSPPCEDVTVEKSNSPTPASKMVAPAFSTAAAAALRRVSLESMSEDELTSPQKGFEITPLRKYGISSKDFSTPAVISQSETEDVFDTKVPMTPLAAQLNSWSASSPDKQNATRPLRSRGMFSLGGANSLPAPEIMSPAAAESLAKTSFFEDGIAIEDASEDVSYEEMAVDNLQNQLALSASQESQASEEYGDENALPINPELLGEQLEVQEHTLTCTPAKVFTPAKPISQYPREIHTVSKVPLRASAEDLPLKVNRQRSRSFGGPLAIVKDPRGPNVGHGESGMMEAEKLASSDNMHSSSDQPITPILKATPVPQTPSSGMKLDAETPGRTVRKGVVPDVLKGAVVHVDVHTTEGADASGIFVDLLTQMGARCLKKWSWNPRTTIGTWDDKTSSSDENEWISSPSVNKVGITHVVYKDGGKRTLEKVRSSNGVVQCVGVGWVLE